MTEENEGGLFGSAASDEGGGDEKVSEPKGTPGKQGPTPSEGTASGEDEPRQTASGEKSIFADRSEERGTSDTGEPTDEWSAAFQNGWIPAKRLNAKNARVESLQTELQESQAEVTSLQGQEGNAALVGIYPNVDPNAVVRRAKEDAHFMNVLEEHQKIPEVASAIKLLADKGAILAKEEKDVAEKKNEAEKPAQSSSEGDGRYEAQFNAVLRERTVDILVDNGVRSELRDDLVSEAMTGLQKDSKFAREDITKALSLLIREKGWTEEFVRGKEERKAQQPPIREGVAPVDRTAVARSVAEGEEKKIESPFDAIEARRTIFNDLISQTHEEGKPIQLA